MSFTKSELDVLSAGLDMLIRAEGQAMTQHGSAGLRGGRGAILADRITQAMAALDKIEAEAQALAMAAQTAAQSSEPVAGG